MQNKEISTFVYVKFKENRIKKIKQNKYFPVCSLIKRSIILK